MNIHFIYITTGQFPDDFISTWLELFPGDSIDDVTLRQRDEGRVLMRDDQVLRLVHNGGIQEAHGKKTEVFKILETPVSIVCQTGVSREIDLEPLVDKIIPLPPRVFGPSSSEQSKTYERNGVRHVIG